MADNTNNPQQVQLTPAQEAYVKSLPSNSDLPPDYYTQQGLTPPPTATPKQDSSSFLNRFLAGESSGLNKAFFGLPEAAVKFFSPDFYQKIKQLQAESPKTAGESGAFSSALTNVAGVPGLIESQVNPQYYKETQAQEAAHPGAAIAGTIGQTIGLGLLGGAAGAPTALQFATGMPSAEASIMGNVLRGATGAAVQAVPRQATQILTGETTPGDAISQTLSDVGLGALFGGIGGAITKAPKVLGKAQEYFGNKALLKAGLNEEALTTNAIKFAEGNIDDAKNITNGIIKKFKSSKITSPNSAQNVLDGDNAFWANKFKTKINPEIDDVTQKYVDEVLSNKSLVDSTKAANSKWAEDFNNNLKNYPTLADKYSSINTTINGLEQEGNLFGIENLYEDKIKYLSNLENVLNKNGGVSLEVKINRFLNEENAISKVFNMTPEEAANAAKTNPGILSAIKHFAPALVPHVGAAVLGGIMGGVVGRPDTLTEGLLDVGLGALIGGVSPYLAEKMAGTAVPIAEKISPTMSKMLSLIPPTKAALDTLPPEQQTTPQQMTLDQALINAGVEGNQAQAPATVSIQNPVQQASPVSGIAAGVGATAATVGGNAPVAPNAENIPATKMAPIPNLPTPGTETIPAAMETPAQTSGSHWEDMNRQYAVQAATMNKALYGGQITPSQVNIPNRGFANGINPTLSNSTLTKQATAVVSNLSGVKNNNYNVLMGSYLTKQYDIVWSKYYTWPEYLKIAAAQTNNFDPAMSYRLIYPNASPEFLKSIRSAEALDQMTTDDFKNIGAHTRVAKGLIANALTVFGLNSPINVSWQNFVNNVVTPLTGPLNESQQNDLSKQLAVIEREGLSPMKFKAKIIKMLRDRYNLNTSQLAGLGFDLGVK